MKLKPQKTTGVYGNCNSNLILPFMKFLVGRVCFMACQSSPFEVHTQKGPFQVFQLSR